MDVISFPGFPLLQFWSLAVCKYTSGRRPTTIVNTTNQTSYTHLKMCTFSLTGLCLLSWARLYTWEEQRTAPRRRQVGVAPEARREWEGHFSHLYTWVGPSFFCACTSLERAWARSYSRICSQCNQRRTRVRAEALKQG